MSKTITASEMGKLGMKALNKKLGKKGRRERAMKAVKARIEKAKMAKKLSTPRA